MSSCVVHVHKGKLHVNLGELRLAVRPKVLVPVASGQLEIAVIAGAHQKLEFVIAVTGKVEARSGGVNENLATGAIEVRAASLRILSESETPPFPIEETGAGRRRSLGVRGWAPDSPWPPPACC